MGVPSNHPNFSRIFLYQPSIFGYPHFWKPPYIYIYIYMYIYMYIYIYMCIYIYVYIYRYTSVRLKMVDTLKLQ